MDLKKLEDADKATKAAAKEAALKVAETKRRFKVAKEGARGAKAELRKARTLLEAAKAAVRRAEKRARNKKRKLSQALKSSDGSSGRPERTDFRSPKRSTRRPSDPENVGPAAPPSSN